MMGNLKKIKFIVLAIKDDHFFLAIFHLASHVLFQLINGVNSTEKPRSHQQVLN